MLKVPKSKSKISVVLLVLLLSACSPKQDPAQLISTGLCFNEGVTCHRGETQLLVNDASMRSEQPLPIQLNLPEQTQIISARLEGRDMFMGVIPVQFNTQGQADLLYGSCHSGQMVWRLFVNYQVEDQEAQTVWFDWQADRVFE